MALTIEHKAEIVKDYQQVDILKQAAVIMARKEK